MKKLLILSILAISFGNSEIITIIDKGIERKIDIPSQNIKARYLNEKSSGILVLFNKNIDINNFKNKYSLELKKRLTIGYYIFENNSKLNDIELISKIYKENKRVIKTIRPNWALGMMPR